MTKLELVIAAMDECRIPGTRPTVLTGLSREAQLFSDWSDRAWMEIQASRKDWNFLKGSFSFATSIDDLDYTPAQAGITDLRAWEVDTLRIYETAVGIADEQWLVYWEYPVFRDVYQYGPQVSSRPTVFAVHPNKSLLLGAVPDKVYTVRGEYWKRPSTLATDATELPLDNEALHMLVVYKVMTFYGYEQSAMEFIQRGADGFRALHPQLEEDELPPVGFGGRFA